ncbi:MAG: hypothetical protein LWX83_05390 [Anaerolineae bacterium]|nr:hypothetical protein [Anaerolineae bacterium]
MKTIFDRFLKIGLVLLVLVLTSLACGPSLTIKKEATLTARPEVKQPEATLAPTETSVPTTAAQPTQGGAPAPAATVTVTATTAPTPAAEEQPSEAWRISPFPQATLIASDHTGNLAPASKEFMDDQVSNLAIPTPYYFEFYVLPAGTTALDVNAHYDKLMKAAGMKLARNDQGWGGVTLMTWLHNSVKGRKYAVQFNPADVSRGQENPVLFIIYSNPPKE